MIGNPTDFRHTVHGSGGGNLQVCVCYAVVKRDFTQKFS